VGLYLPVLTGGALSSVTLLGASAPGAVEAQWTDAGWAEVALSAPVVLTAGQPYYVASLSNAGLPPGGLYFVGGVLYGPYPPEMRSPLADYTALPANLPITSSAAIAGPFAMAVS
jgi:hypothetical protein